MHSISTVVDVPHVCVVGMAGAAIVTLDPSGSHLVALEMSASTVLSFTASTGKMHETNKFSNSQG